jgi:3-oxoadipate enol-lactonase
MPYAFNGDTRLYYEIFGEGEPLLLIMGLGGTLQGWALQIPALAEHYRVIALDNRGAGRSDKPDAPYDTATFAADTVSVLDAAELDSAHVLGVSMGGLIAQELYHRYPQRLRSLILGCCGVGPDDPAGIPAAEDVLAALALDRRTTPVREVVAAMAKAFYHPEYRARVPRLVERLVKVTEADPQPAHAYEHQLRACYQPPHNSPRLGEIQVPTLVLHGEHDRVWPLANAEYLAKHIPGARLHVIEQAAHMFMLERPKAFNRAVLEFLAGLRT